MNLSRYFLLSICIVTLHTTHAKDNSYLFRVILRDKQPTSYRIDNPSDFLSDRALERRKRWNIAIDSTDLPIAQSYIGTIELMGGRVVARSRWLNSVVVALADSSDITKIAALPIVTSSYCTYYPTKSKTASVSKFKDTITRLSQAISPIQRSMIQADALHNEGYRGAGMQIAVIDAGFWNVDIHVGIDQSHILGTKDFTYPPSSDIYREFSHGMNVLSIMLSQSKEYVGTAPEASYYLLRSEMKDREWPVEQDYWISAAEYADSVGVDLINSSLGYGLYDMPHYNIEKQDLDGKTTWIARGATIAASKGILVVNSAGNEGDTPWRHILTPADVPTLLTVGSVRFNSQVSPFSSRGYQLLKPDVMGMGEGALIMDENGDVFSSNGTSFSAPLICGMMASLWQALPHLSAQELMQCVREGSNRAILPDLDYGYGIPSFYDIYTQHKDASLDSTPSDDPIYSSYSRDGEIVIEGLVEGDSVDLITLSGQITQSTRYIEDHNSTLTIPVSSNGAYLIRIVNSKGQYTLKIIV